MTARRVDVRLRPDASSLAFARAAVRDVCDDRCAPDRIVDAELVVTELVSNAIRHGLPPIRLSLELETSEVPVLDMAVSDAGAQTPIVRPRSLEPGGRGLRIVAALSREWGAETTSAGTRVRAQLPLGAPSSPA